MAARINGNRQNNAPAPEPDPPATPNQVLAFLHDTNLPVTDRLYQAAGVNIPRAAPPRVVNDPAEDILGPVPAQEPARHSTK